LQPQDGCCHGGHWLRPHRRDDGHVLEEHELGGIAHGQGGLPDVLLELDAQEIARGRFVGVSEGGWS